MAISKAMLFALKTVSQLHSASLDETVSTCPPKLLDLTSASFDLMSQEEKTEMLEQARKAANELAIMATCALMELKVPNTLH